MNRGPYNFDEVIVKHRNITTNSIVNAKKFDVILNNLEDAYDYEIGYIPPEYAHRPDRISNLFYGSPKNWWLLMLVNGVEDPFEGFNANDVILIPKLR